MCNLSNASLRLHLSSLIPWTASISDITAWTRVYFGKLLQSTSTWYYIFCYKLVKTLLSQFLFWNVRGLKCKNWLIFLDGCVLKHNERIETTGRVLSLCVFLQNPELWNSSRPFCMVKTKSTPWVVHQCRDTAGEQRKRQTPRTKTEGGKTTVETLTMRRTEKSIHRWCSSVLHRWATKTCVDLITMTSSQNVWSIQTKHLTYSWVSSFTSQDKFSFCIVYWYAWWSNDGKMKW